MSVETDKEAYSEIPMGILTAEQQLTNQKLDSQKHLQEMEVFLREFCLSDSTLGVLMRKDPNYVKLAREGRISRRRTIRDNRAWMEHYKATHT